MSYATSLSVTITGIGNFPLMYPGALSTASARSEREMLRAAFCDTGSADLRLVAAFNELSPDCDYGVPVEAVFDTQSRTLRGDFSAAEIPQSMHADLDEFQTLLGNLVDYAGQVGTVTVYIGLE